MEFHEQGFILLGRIDRIIKLGDERVSLVRIEQDLMKHPWVNDCYIALHPNRQRPVAWVELSASAIDILQSQGRKELIAELRRYLLTTQEKFVLPRYWRFTDKLPRNSQSKISRIDFERVCLSLDSEPFIHE